MKFVQFTIGAADSLVKALIPASANYFITMPSTSTLVFTAIGGVATADVITVTFTTADATYQSHYAVIDAIALASKGKSNPNAIMIPKLPLVGGSTQQLITSVAIA